MVTVIVNNTQNICTPACVSENYPAILSTLENIIGSTAGDEHERRPVGMLEGGLLGCWL